MGSTLRVVNYAVNGSGVGHLTRLVAINRWIRRYAAATNTHAEVYFLTSSEADSLLFNERFASFKMPSKTSVEDAGIDKLTYLALAKQWVWHSFALLRPDVLIVDTFPRGSFGELLGALDLCKRKVFVHRPVKDDFAARADFQAMLPLYDLIVVPETEGVVELKLPEAARARTRFTGPTIVRERAELLARDEARAQLGIAPERLAVFLSAGGGGDPHAEARIHALCDALLADESLHLVVGAGPLYRGRSRHGARLTWLNAHGASELLAAMDVAVSAAGYNTFHELMFVGVPTVFLPQEKVADEQDVRARRAVERGAAVMLSPDASPESLREAIDAWRAPEARAAASDAARALMPENHARRAAAEILRVALGARAVETAERVVDDGLLARAASLSVSLDALFELMRELDAGDDPMAARASAERLAVFANTHAVPVSALKRLVGALCRKLPQASASERGACVESVLSSLAPFADWAGALVLVRTLSVERSSGVELASAFEAFVAPSRAAGEDLYKILARLTAAQTRLGEGAAHRELFTEARK